MSKKARINLEVSPELHADLQRIADESGTSMTNVFRVAFALYLACHKAKKTGQHIGLVSDPSKLDTVLVGLI